MAAYMHGDSCWDTVCTSYDRDEKLACLQNKNTDICGCCSQNATSDCEILVPGYGLYDACGDRGSVPSTPPAQPDDGDDGGSIIPDVTKLVQKSSDNFVDFVKKNKTWIFLLLGLVILVLVLYILFSNKKKK